MGLNLNLQKTTLMSTVKQVNIFSDGEDISTVTNCKVLVVLITNDSCTNEETKKRISLSKLAMGNFTKIIKALEVSTNTKVKLLQTAVFTAVLYGCKGKEIKERLMMPWTVRRVHVSVTKHIRPKTLWKLWSPSAILKYF